MKKCFYFIWLLSSALACKQEKAPVENFSKGELLSKTYCVSCHIYPEPNLLDSNAWQKAFDWMGPFMGIYATEDQREKLLGNGDERKALLLANVFPEESAIAKSDFLAIKEWYQYESKNKFKSNDIEVYKFDSCKLFKAKRPAWQNETPSLTAVQFAENEIIAADANTKTIYYLNYEGQIQRKTILPTEATVKLQQQQNTTLALNMGSFSPTNTALGNFILLDNTGTEGVLVEKLRRPVDFVLTDLLNQGVVNDVLFCEFGKWTGGLSWYSSQSGVLTFKKFLDTKPGAIKVVVKDVDNDGLQDVMALYGQAREGLFLYKNLGNGNFKTKQLLAFPPSFGSSFFELVDFDNDGFLDLLYINGDNADIGQVEKPYQGIHFYINNGNFEFSERHFIPFPGAYKAICNDFDADGDLDLAAISFFPNFKNEQYQSLVFFENEGNYQYKPSIIRC